MRRGELDDESWKIKHVAFADALSVTLTLKRGFDDHVLGESISFGF